MLRSLRVRTAPISISQSEGVQRDQHGGGNTGHHIFVSEIEHQRQDLVYTSTYLQEPLRTNVSWFHKAFQLPRTPAS